MRGSGNSVSFKDVDWRHLQSLIPYLLEFKSRVVLALVCLIAAKVASVWLPFILKHIVDSLENSSTLSAFIAIPIGLLLAYGLVRFSNVIFSEIRDTLFGRVTERAMRRIGLKAFQHLHSLELDFHLNRQTGGLSRDIERGTNGISFLMRFMVFNIIPTLLEVILVMGLLWYNYSVWFAVIVLVSIVCYIGFSIYATEIRTRFVRQMNQAESTTSTRAIDSLMNYETVKYFTNEQYEANLYDDDLAGWERARRKNRLSLFALNGGQAFIISASMTGAMVLAAYNVTTNEMTIGDFVAINAFMMQIFMPLNFLGFVYREMKGSMANIEKLFSLLAHVPKVTDSNEAKNLEVNEGKIQFNSVSFGYQPQRKIFNALSFDIRAKQKVAVVGSSGAGKSTLFKLLFRFYDPSAGRIEIDGQDIATVTQQSLRAAISVVPQDTVLFNTSIFENIRYGKIDAPDSEVFHAIELAHLDPFIEQLPEKENTLVGERGLKLSGGEKQRVAIARAILKGAPIMVFDEATSSLDSKSEQSILSAIREISENQTTLVIAHRLSTIVDADKIIVLSQGEIVEAGTHSELIGRDSTYAHLWRLQQSENN